MKRVWYLSGVYSIALILLVSAVVPLLSGTNVEENANTSSSSPSALGSMSMSPQASLAGALTNPETMWLDLYSVPGYPRVTSESALEKGKLYTVSIEGTASNWAPQYWFDADDPPAGPWEGAPMYPSPGTVTGPVGHDPYYMFACIFGEDYSPGPLPYRYTMRMSLDNWSSYKGISPCIEDQYNSTHLYHFFVTGQGGNLGLMFVDAQSSDNYGMFKIVISVAPDADGDGIPDQWERAGNQYGIDFDNDRNIDIRPADYGADWQHKDIFVEVDYVDGHRLLDSAIVDLMASFRNAPVKNPDNDPGIHLWILVGDNIGPVNALVLDDKWTNFNNEKKFWFGTIQERQTPIKVKAKQLFFHYCLFVNDLSWKGRNIGGLGERPGNDFIVADSNLNGSAGDRYLQSRSFMHELGHNLDLLHGGQDGINNKPNYPSVMTYQYWLVPNLPLDYSRALLNNLTESDLDETTGIKLPVGYTGSRLVVFSAKPPGGANYTVCVAVAGRSVDWDMDGSPNDVHIVSNVNDFEPSGAFHTPSGETLIGSEDWSHIKYFYLESDNYMLSYHDGTPDDYEPAVIQAINEQIRHLHNVAVVSIDPPSSQLYGDVNIEATVANLGGNQETFQATLYCDDQSIGSVQCTLPRLNISQVTIPCNLTSVAKGAHTLSLKLSEVAFENATWDNELDFGTVQVTDEHPDTQDGGLGMLEIGIIVVVLVAVVVAALIFMRKSRKNK